MPADSVDTAMLLEALAARGDPMTRFVASLSGELRTFAEDTIRLRQEFEINVQRILTCSDPRESSRHAAWVTQHVGDVSYRWSMLLKAVARCSELDTESFNYRFRGV